MKFTIMLICCLLVGGALAKRRHNKRDRAARKKAEDNEVEGGYASQRKDPCQDKRCGLGYQCDLDEDFKPICVCQKSCDVDDDPRNQVCTTKNVTFSSECEMHRQRCLCRKKDDDCMNRAYRNARLHYYGACKKLPKCVDEEMEEFPLRMREWLYLIMEELAERRDLSGESMKMAREARKTKVKRWTLPIIWKYCDLDVNQDKFVNSHELLPIAAPLIPMEHCLTPFLDTCDKDDDGVISLHEWGVCLGLKDDEISDTLEERCNRIRSLNHDKNN